MSAGIAYKLIDSIPPEYLNAAERIQYAVGEYITNPNEPVKYFYILLSGSAKLMYEGAKGEPLILDIYHAGDFSARWRWSTCRRSTGRSSL